MREEPDESLAATGLVLGIVFGAGVATVAATLVDQSVAVTGGYGAGGGLVVGALTGRLAEANWGEERWPTRVIGGGGVVGLLVGVALGALVAWTGDADVTAGALVGGPAGLVHGLLVGGVIVANERAKD
jgi:hypothetical protein